MLVYPANTATIGFKPGTHMRIVSLQSITAFACDDAGAVAIEYSMIAVGMFLAIIASFPSISSAVKGKFLSVGGYFATIQ